MLEDDGTDGPSTKTVDFESHKVIWHSGDNIENNVDDDSDFEDSDDE